MCSRRERTNGHRWRTCSSAQEIQMEPQLAYRQLGSRNTDGGAARAVMRGVHVREAKPSKRDATAHMQCGSEDADEGVVCVAIQGVLEAQAKQACSPSWRTCSMAQKHGASECVAVQGVREAKPSAHAATVGTHAARIGERRWRNGVCSHTGRTRSQAKRACSLRRRTCSSAQKMQMEN